MSKDVVLDISVPGEMHMTQPNPLRIIALIVMLFSFAGCVGVSSDEALESALSLDKPAEQEFSENQLGFAAPAPQLEDRILETGRTRSNSKTYLVNGLASAASGVGYGFTALSQKIPDSKLYNYTTFIEASTVIKSSIFSDIKNRYKKDPNIKINLIGMSYGANIVTQIAASMRKSGIPVNYLATLDGPLMSPLGDNIAVNDNFVCLSEHCFKTETRLVPGNKDTDVTFFKVKTMHVELSAHKKVHNRILSQINKS